MTPCGQCFLLCAHPESREGAERDLRARCKSDWPALRINSLKVRRLAMDFLSHWGPLQQYLGGPLRTYRTHICDRLARSITDTDKLPLSTWGIIREMETVQQSACGCRTRSFSNLLAVAPVVSGGLHTTCLACILTRSAPLGAEHYLNETAGCW